MSILIRNNAQEKLDSKIFSLRKKKADFEVLETTGTSQLTYTYNGVEKSILYIMDIYNDGPTEHNPAATKTNSTVIRNVCRKVKSDAEKFLVNNPLPEVDMDNFITMDHKKHLIQAMVKGDIVHEIDINSCYWTLAYQKRFISQECYRKYLPYKHERLIGLGNLAKVKYRRIFRNGRQKDNIKERSPLANFFFSIICDTFKIYQEIDKAIDKKVFYFKTDAFWVPPSIHIENKIEAVLNKHGLGYKKNRLRIKEILPNKIIATNIATGEDRLIVLTNC